MQDFINLLPDELSRPKRSGPEEIIPVSNAALPDFGVPSHLMPDNFWSNLKQFLFERPVKIIERSDVPFTKNTFGQGMRDNLRFFFSAPAVPEDRCQQAPGSRLGRQLWQLHGPPERIFQPHQACASATRHPTSEGKGYLVEG